MKAIIQRVTSAKVTVGDELISSIGRGLCVLIGICQDDTQHDADYLAKKILNIRLFEEAGKRWSKNVTDEQMEILCISQFTLYYKLKGNKPDFHLAMQGSQASELYNLFLQKLKDSYKPEKIKDGKFGEYMQVHIQNDGPVTIELESPKQSQQQIDLLNKKNKRKEEKSNHQEENQNQ